MSQRVPILVGLAAAIAGVAVLWFPTLQTGQAIALLGFGVLAVASLLLPQLAKERSASLASASTALSALQDRLADLEAVKREHYKSRTANEALVSKVAEHVSRMEQQIATVQALAEAYQRIETDLMEKRQINGELKREVERWRKGVVDSLDAGKRALASNEPMFIKGVESQLTSLEKAMRDLSLIVIRPKGGDEFDEREHDVVDKRAQASAKAGSIIECIDWGYSHRGEVVKRAKVVLVAESAPASAQASLDAGLLEVPKQV